ncbi:MAG: SusC/RagA family TonB-linked outer membrane protein, partial [Bacteroidales bacterium]|nr:SusC/RagA family TonB-linked outer membrane protein [Bacteroidales bacterium]
MQKSRQLKMLIGLSILLLLMLELSINHLYASDNLQEYNELVQNNKLKGIVRSKKNNDPIPGVNVTIKGSFIGTITNEEGEFYLEYDQESAQLVFSFVGMKKQEVKAFVGETLSILMEDDAIGLDEIVTIGYGTMKKSDLSGSVESVTAESFKNQPVTTISQALQGRLSGVVVSSNSGSPGSEAKIRIRGINSMKGDNNPLYVVDGVPLNVGIGNINVKDIQSIEVLKDASATAIYGSRGANGVILITTKRGLKNGESHLELNINTGISSLPQKYDLLNITDFAKLVNEYRPDYYSEEQMNEFSMMPGIDWQDEIYKLGLTQDYQLNISGGNEDMQYYLSGNYVDQTGILLNGKESKYSVRSNVSVNVLDNLNVDMNLYIGKKNGLNNMANGGKNSPTWNALIYSPTFPIYDENGDWNMQDKLASPNARNPIMMLEEQFEDYFSNTTTFNTKATYKFLSDFTFDIVYGADFNSYQRGSVQNEYITSGKTSAALSERKSFTWTNQNILTYNKNINDFHRITATAVNEQSSFENSGFNAYGSEVSPISVGYDNLGIAKSQSIGSWRSKVTMQSYIGRIAYSLKDRYLLTATYRADGTSKFQGANK